MSLRKLPPMAQLRAFAAVVETGSMSAAGALLNVSHAAISQQVRALEAHLGVQLLRKDGRGVALTIEGARLGETLTAAYGAIAREIDAMTGADAARPLQITTTPMFAAAWLMPRLGAFRQAHPEIDIMLNPTAATVTLEPGGIDLAIRFGKGIWSGLESKLLIHTDFVIAAARSLIGDRVISEPADLLDFPWFQESGSTEINRWLASQGIAGGKVKGLMEIPGNLSLDGLRQGHGVVAVTRTFIEADVARGDVVVLFQDEEPGFGYFVVHRPGPLRAPARLFINWLHRMARDAD